MTGNVSPEAEGRIMFLLGSIGSKLDAHMISSMESTARIERRLDDGQVTINSHTDALRVLTGETQGQNDVLEKIVKRQEELRTAITRDGIVDGIVDGAKRWSPVIAILTVIVGAIFSVYAWFAHLSIVATVLRLFKGGQ